MYETLNRRPVDSETESLLFRALAWTQAIARPVSPRRRTFSCCVTPRLHLNFLPCLSASYLLQLSCKSSGWCPPLVPLGRFSLQSIPTQDFVLTASCYCVFFPSSCRHGCLCCFRAVWCRRSGLSRPYAGWRDVKSALHFIRNTA